jgi:hypothetical protein
MVTLGQTVVPINSVIMAASLANVPKEELGERFGFFVNPCFALYDAMRGVVFRLQGLPHSQVIKSSIPESANETIITRSRAETSSTNGFDYYECEEDGQVEFAKAKSASFTDISNPLQSLSPPIVQPEIKPVIQISQADKLAGNYFQLNSVQAPVKYHSNRLILIHTICRLVLNYSWIWSIVSLNCLT